MTAFVKALPFLALFPGNFAYQWAAKNGWIPLFVGGYVNEVSLVVCAGVLVAKSLSSFLKNGQAVVWSSVDTYFALFMVWFAAVVLLNLALDHAQGTTKNLTGAWVQMLGCYLAMRLVPLDSLRKPLLWMAFLFSAVVLWAAQSDQLATVFLSSENSNEATYQGLARAFLVTAAFGLCGIRRILIRLSGYIIALLVLFLIGARSEIFGALVLFTTYEVLVSYKPMRATILIVAVGSILGVVIGAELDNLTALFPDNRLLLLLVFGRDDGSYLERAVFNEWAWNAVQERPFRGNYGHYEKMASAGSYAHNWVSAWVDLGLIGVVLYLAVPTVAVFSVWRFRRTAVVTANLILQRNACIAIGFLAMVIVFGLAAKTFADPGLATAAGFVAALSTNFRRQRCTDNQSLVLADKRFLLAGR